jgi:hypothetical protein
VVTESGNPKQPLKLNGRAPNPPVITGMGSHSTSWTAETRAVNELVSRAVTAGLNPVEALQDRMLAELATTVTGAAAAYLRFRNQLPYATVDDGDRGGKAEGSSNEANDHIDAASLVEAADTQHNEVGDNDQRAELATVMAAAATSLTTQKATWDARLHAAVDLSAGRLTARSQKLRSDAPTNRSDILNARAAEHSETAELAGLHQPTVLTLELLEDLATRERRLRSR